MNALPSFCDMPSAFDSFGDINAPCTATPTHRWRAPEMVEGFWGLRCTPHAAALDRSHCTVELLAVTS